MTRRGAAPYAVLTAEPAHYAWQTGGGFVSERERALVRAAFLPLAGRVLDVGCGEGATLHHLGTPAGAVGVDLAEAKIAFASQALPACRFVTARAEALPFDAGSFDQVLVRDVVHHVSDANALVDEAYRVLAPGGRIDVLEPCGYNPLIALHALALPSERGELRSTASRLRRLLERRFAVEPTRHLQALPLHRLVFHLRLGRPALAEHRPVRAAVAAAEQLAERLLPRFAWAYLHLRGIRSEP